jgi:hypothetical protein
LEGAVSLPPLLERVSPEDLVALKKSLLLLEPLDGFGSVRTVSRCDRCTSLLLLFGFCGLVVVLSLLLLLLELGFRLGLSFSSLILLGILLGFGCELPLVSLEDRQEVVDAVRLWLSFLLGCFGGVGGCFGFGEGGVSSKYKDSLMLMSSSDAGAASRSNHQG